MRTLGIDLGAIIADGLHSIRGVVFVSSRSLRHSTAGAGSP